MPNYVEYKINLLRYHDIRHFFDKGCSPLQTLSIMARHFKTVASYWRLSIYQFNVFVRHENDSYNINI